MIWFTSDTHYGHERVVAAAQGMGLRCATYKSVSEMDEGLLEACNKYVKPNDTLYHLGDLAFADPAAYRNRIRCKDIRFIIGNHDTAKTWDLFKYNWETRMIQIHGPEMQLMQVWLSHYPHMIWPASHYKSAHLYGHMHNMREAWFDEKFPERRSMDVGVDAIFARTGQYRPISEYEVYDIMAGRKGHDDLEYYKSLNSQEG